jgi:hypothetical protein
MLVGHANLQYHDRWSGTSFALPSVKLVRLDLLLVGEGVPGPLHLHEVSSEGVHGEPMGFPQRARAKGTVLCWNDERK